MATLAVGSTMTPSREQQQIKKHKKSIVVKATASPRSKILKLPEITKMTAINDDDGNDTHVCCPRMKTDHFPMPVRKPKNPFHMPSDMEVFAMREEERKLKLEAKEQLKNQNIYEKNVVKRKNFKELLAEEDDDVDFYDQLRKRDADKILVNRQTRADRHFGKENLHDFIAKKREMFLVQYALGVKRQEMRKLEEIAQAEEQKLLDDEKALEEDAAKFDAFLKENDKNSVEAIKRAEMETKAKLEKFRRLKKMKAKKKDAEKKKTDSEEGSVSNAKVTPSKGARTSAYAKRAKSVKSNTAKPDQSVAGSDDGPNGNHDNSTEAGDNDAEDEEEGYNEEDEPLLFFKSPQQLLDIFSELEENNLALIQNCQETEETLEELKQKIVETGERMWGWFFLVLAINREEEKARSLEERAKLFQTGLVGAESQEQLLEELNHKVKEVYRKCIGDSDANLSTLQMLTSIENKLEQLFESIELMPADKVEQAEKMKDKERRQRLREEKMEAQRALQEERVQRALERARAPVKKKTGKPVLFRSAPPQKKKKKEEFTKKKEEEDLEYYFIL
ncbi:hypothetical protein BC829DRAFT_430335 [Chytridium lagenaria]|nr:hypothetical protein BC829DRAFT_430335 [Chytridium lagenaria]